MNEIRFGDAVESDTIANLLSPITGWVVTLGLDGYEQSGKVTRCNRDGIGIERGSWGEAGRPVDDVVEDFYYWTNVQFVTIH